MRTQGCGWLLLISITVEIPFLQSSISTVSFAWHTSFQYLGIRSFLTISHTITHWTTSRVSMSIGLLITTLSTSHLRCYDPDTFHFFSHMTHYSTRAVTPHDSS